MNLNIGVLYLLTNMLYKAPSFILFYAPWNIAKFEVKINL